MAPWRSLLLSIVLLVCAPAGASAQTSKTADVRELILPIPPIAAAGATWSVPAVADMIFTYYKIPAIEPDTLWNNVRIPPSGVPTTGIYHQCSIVGLAHPDCGYDCRYCDFVPQDARALLDIIDQYPRIARTVSKRAVIILRARAQKGALPFDQVVREIRAQRPVIAKVEDRFVLIVGFHVEKDPRVVINDPIDPVRTGPILYQYTMSYAELTTRGWSGAITIFD